MWLVWDGAVLLWLLLAWVCLWLPGLVATRPYPQPLTFTLPPNSASPPPVLSRCGLLMLAASPCLVGRSTELLCPRARCCQHSHLLRPAWVAMAHPNSTSSPVLLCVCPSPLSFFLFLGLGLPLWLLTRWQILVEGVHQCINSK